jgi:formylglycine-generating enzyme required for sulfatase activity
MILIAVPAESSRKTELAPTFAPGGCPRCGTRLGEPYKYCPNCAYRLRPDLVPPPRPALRKTPLGQRLVALGGYLLFAAMLLLVVFAGVRLFTPPEATEPVQPQVLQARDGGCLALTLDEFVEVPAGTAFWGAYDPGREYAAEGGAETAAKEKDAAEAAARALATLIKSNAKPEEVAEARARLKDALGDLPERDAIKRWAEAFDLSIPKEPVEGTPDAYLVDDPFRMARREVTNDQYFEFLRAWARKAGRPVLPHLIPGGWTRKTGTDDVPRIYKRDEGNLPVVNIPFDAALEFCGWFWEERLGADPNLVVDLPTWKEWVLAARGDNLLNNFPWGRTLRQGNERVNLDGVGLWSVVADRNGRPLDPAKDAEFYNGFLDLVGNAAEWIYWKDEGLVVAGGWSYADDWVYKVSKAEPGQPARLVTAFSGENWRVVGGQGEGMRDVGFRPVIRHAPALPSFVKVTAGAVHHAPCPEGILPPERLDAEDTGEIEGSEPETLEQIRARREPLITFPETEHVDRDFEISATEVTNRQYLAFLAAIAPGYTKAEIDLLVPRGWKRKNNFERLDKDDRPLPRAFEGYYVPREKLETLYAPGQENVPVQGVSIEQADAYVAWLSRKLGHRCSIPTVAQWLRAARGDSTSPYPWGTYANDAELSPSNRPEPLGRALSLPVSRDRPIVGLAGNVAELVRDESAGGRILLAGGFYYLPARLVTLDCFLDASWDTIQYVLEPGDWDLPLEDMTPDENATRLSVFFTIDHYAGLRVVRLPDPF